jgi:hypothetical protein
MRWRIVGAALLALIGGAGPTVALLLTFGPQATLEQWGNDPLVIMGLVGLALLSAVCCLGAGALIRSDQLSRLRDEITLLFQTRQRRHA